MIDTSLPPAAARACATASAMPVVTNVYVELPCGTSSGTSWVSTNSGAPGSGPSPFQPSTMSYVRLPEMTAPTRPANSSKNSALGLLSWNEGYSRLGVSPSEYHSNSRSPPMPRGRSRLSSGPAM